MRWPALLAVLIGISLALAGCLAGDPEPVDELDPVDPAEGDDGNGDGNGNGDVPPGTPGEEPSFSAEITQFAASGGKVGENVTFTLEVATDDPAATWRLATGDGAEYDGEVAGLPGSLLHAYSAAGNHTAVLVVTFNADETISAETNLSIVPARVFPETLVFEYGPSLGCFDVAILCLGVQLEMDGIDGYWQELDERYWGLDFIVTADSATGDTDCAGFDADGALLDTYHQDGDPCGGTLADGTASLFMYNWIEPALSLKLEFFLPA